MALIKCSECGKDISDKAKHCVHCGNKILNDEQKLKIKVKKENRSERKLLAKIIFITISLIIGLPIIYLLIAYFFPRKNINFIEKYNDYLNYALGDNWIVADTHAYRSFKNFWFTETTEWSIDYEMIDYTKDTFSISNYRLADFKDMNQASDYVFASEILYRYREVLNRTLSKGKVSELDSSINIIDLSEIDTNLFLKRLPEIIDSKNGLLFKDANINRLQDDLYYLELGVLYTSGSDVNGYTIKEAKKIIEHYNIKNAVISAGSITNGVGETSPIYCLKRGIEVSCPIETELGSMNNAIANRNDYIYLD